MVAYLATTLGLFLVLAVITVIDVRCMIIPNSANIALLLLGLVAQVFILKGDPGLALIGPLVLGGLLWGVRDLHRRLTGRIGLGLGDVKMAGAAGAWIGLSAIPSFLLVSSVSALFVAISLGKLRARSPHKRIPFGPFLSFGLIVSWFSNTLPIEVMLP